MKPPARAAAKATSKSLAGVALVVVWKGREWSGESMRGIEGSVGWLRLTRESEVYEQRHHAQNRPSNMQCTKTECPEIDLIINSMSIRRRRISPEQL